MNLLYLVFLSHMDPVPLKMYSVVELVWSEVAIRALDRGLVVRACSECVSQCSVCLHLSIILSSDIEQCI